ncbi:MAG: FAD-binding oxidoreductase [Chloroflexi bacterium]|nr:FAD-binding oxidoreductase [Chloroflexota bacterium]
MPSEATPPFDLTDFGCPSLSGVATEQFSIQGIAPKVVLLPTTEKEVAAALKAASARQLTLAPYGGGTLQEIGYPPEALDIVLSTRGLNRIITYEPADLTISVQAGCTLAQISAVLAAHGQMLPFDAVGADQATIGGLVASNLTGPRRFGGGSYRDFLIGVAIAYADGTVAKAGGQVVKNVSGYDLMKLHLGALGTLGVLLRLNFKVLTQRPVDITTIATGPLNALLPLVATLATSQLSLDSVELLGPSSLRDEAADWRLAERITGSQVGAQRKLTDLHRLADSHGCRMTTLGATEAQELWQDCASFISPGTVSNGEVLIRISVQPSGLSNLVSTVTGLAHSNNLDCSVVAHAGDGTLFARLTGSDLTAAFRPLWESLTQGHANALILAAPGDLKGEVNLWGQLPSGFDLMRRIKAEFDPHRLLNRGRFIGHL